MCLACFFVRGSINKPLNNSTGQPDKEIFFNGIHISEVGYKIWAQDILANCGSALGR
jgi:hypothetical protein